jgi:hypothetical protein
MQTTEGTVTATSSSRLGELHIAYAPAGLRFAYYLAGDP